MKVLMIDNYDSFTYNLVQYLGELGCELHVHRNDQITLDEVRHLEPDRIVISPGPGTPPCDRPERSTRVSSPSSCEARGV